MDDSTADYYRHYAHRLATSPEASRSAMMQHVERALLPRATVLDVGCGSGRDVAAMLQGGFDAFGVEPSPAMLESALHLHPELQGRIEPSSLPGLGRPFASRVPDGFDAVVCSAVLMHLDPDEIVQALEGMVAQLRQPAGPDADIAMPALLLSIPHLDPARLIAQRDADGRLFHNHDPVRLRHHLAGLGLSLESSDESHAMFATTGTLWKTLVFRRRAQMI